ncbi:uncharacterized protein SETTUDRAFT_155053 [Exserohilum turcica Et28A]|uniref:Major facilitator superfamily (MFS) profile domain-containing protein n=1 Tax=Exserohilum turcicum (strain 28A) TaxID=671987 RepID=R0JX55_EXST2|nr:uncharacterized protein SETTUDRAFT_155053 [Exserohilum turcica Et28A]EOA85518.1 hypothetical protein SETTUDRAFT_155053 [Exserohilum turcica Et28A]
MRRIETRTSHKRKALLKAQRRGLWANLSIIPEVEEPSKYSAGKKWAMTIIVALAAATSSTGSAIFYPALRPVADDLHTSQTVINLSLAFYLFIMAITPMWWSSWSETLGRRTVYISSFLLFVIFSAISAVSVNIEMLILFRILTGGAAGAVQTVGSGTVSDLWEPRKRGKAMGIFFLGPLCGPGIAPIIGGILTQTLGWRSTLWALCIFGGVLLLSIILLLPETVARRTPEKKSPMARFIDPIKTLGLLQHPPVLVTVFSGGLSFAALYIINIAIQSDYSSAPYNFDEIIVGLLYIAPMLGYAVASQTGGRWIDYLMARGAQRASRYDAEGKLIYLPEDRMQENMWIAASLYPGAMIWYGWVTEYGVHWIVSCIANFFFGIGAMLVFGAVTTMLTEFTPKRASAGVALNNCVRQVLATIATVVVQPLINAIGTGWMCTMIALFCWVTGNAAIYMLKRNGPQWREKMEKKLDATKKQEK